MFNLQDLVQGLNLQICSLKKPSHLTQKEWRRQILTSRKVESIFQERFYQPFLFFE